MKFWKMVRDILEGTGRDLNSKYPIHCGDDECHDDHGPDKGGQKCIPSCIRRKIKYDPPHLDNMHRHCPCHCHKE